MEKRECVFQTIDRCGFVIIILKDGVVEHQRFTAIDLPATGRMRSMALRESVELLNELGIRRVHPLYTKKAISQDLLKIKKVN